MVEITGINERLLRREVARLKADKERLEQKVGRIRHVVERYSKGTYSPLSLANQPERTVTVDDLEPVLSDDVIHACPPDGSGIMTCCERTPFEVQTERMTNDPVLVTCRGWNPQEGST